MPLFPVTVEPWPGVALRGSLVLLVLLTLLLLLNTLGLGLLVSTLVSTQQQAMMTATFVLMIPQIYLSGLIFPIENMPRFFQAISYEIPLRYYARILRGIFLKGSGDRGVVAGGVGAGGVRGDLPGAGGAAVPETSGLRLRWL